MDKPPAAQPGSPNSVNKVRSYIALALVALAAVLLVAWLVSGDDEDSEAGSGAAEIVSVEQLEDALVGKGGPVYWAGEQQGAEIELSRPEAGRTYIRYLTGDAEAGDPRADFLTVGSYVHPDPVAALRKQGRESGGVLGTAPGKAVVYFSRNQPSSVYLAYPGVDVEIEVFDPNFTKALQLVNSGQIVPVD